jgi:O-antigen/teichoic acid export membrane protein
MMNLLHYTGTMLPGEICLFLNYNMDNMIVGWRLGPEQLGHYSLAYTLGMFLAIVSGAIMLSVIFPLFSRLQSQRDQLLVCYQQVLGAVGVLGTPITIWLIMEAPIFIPWVFGEKWTPAIVPLQTICSLGLLRTIAMQPASALAKAIGRPDLSSRNAMVLTPLALAGFLFGSRFGIVGVSTAALLVLGAGSLFFAYIVIGVAGWKLTEIVRSLAWPAIVGLGTFSILALRRTIWSLDSWSLQIAADLSLLIFVYGLIILKLGPRFAAITHRKV